MLALVCDDCQHSARKKPDRAGAGQRLCCVASFQGLGAKNFRRAVPSNGHDAADTTWRIAAPATVSRVGTGLRNRQLRLRPATEPLARRTVRTEQSPEQPL